MNKLLPTNNEHIDGRFEMTYDASKNVVKACCIKQFMCALPAKHKRFNLLTGLKDVVHYDVISDGSSICQFSYDHKMILATILKHSHKLRPLASQFQIWIWCLINQICNKSITNMLKKMLKAIVTIQDMTFPCLLNMRGRYNAWNINRRNKFS